MKIEKIDTLKGGTVLVELTGKQLAPFYIDALFFANYEELDGHDLHPDTAKKIEDYCQQFLDYAIEKNLIDSKYTVDFYGQNFYFSSAHHGCGFFDYGLNALQDLAGQFPLDFYVGDDLIYGV
jgi:hypothetical protein